MGMSNSFAQHQWKRKFQKCCLLPKLPVLYILCGASYFPTSNDFSMISRHISPQYLKDWQQIFCLKIRSSALDLEICSTGLEAHERKLMCTALRWIALSYSNCPLSNTAAILMPSFHTMAINVFLKTSPVYNTEEKPYFQDHLCLLPLHHHSSLEGSDWKDFLLNLCYLFLCLLFFFLFPLHFNVLGKKWTNLFLWIPSTHLEKEHYSVNSPGLML